MLGLCRLYFFYYLAVLSSLYPENRISRTSDLYPTHRIYALTSFHHFAHYLRSSPGNDFFRVPPFQKYGFDVNYLLFFRALIVYLLYLFN